MEQQDLFVDCVIAGVRSLGPGVRIGIWVEGCSLACPGCLSPHLFGRRDQSRVSISAITEQILALAKEHEGLTVSGGEPVQQAGALARVLEEVRSRSDLDVLLYSGYRLEKIRRSGRDAERLLCNVDVLIDGRYIRSQPTRKIWRGSANQKMHILGSRAAKYRDYVDTDGQSAVQPVLAADGQLRIVGIPAEGHADALARRLASKGIFLQRRE